MKGAKWSLRIITVFIVGLLLLSLRPISISTNNCQHLTAVVKSVHLTTSNDVEITLMGDNRTFYINRAPDKNLDIPWLISHLPAQSVSLLYAQQWTILDPLSRYRHLCALSVGNDVLFSELD
jgi:hypothetical protein